MPTRPGWNSNPTLLFSIGTDVPIGRPCRIVVAEGDGDIRGVLAQALRLVGYDVEATANGREAREAIAREVPRLLLLDWRLPLDGREVIAEIRRRGLAVPIVLMTTEGDAEARARELGVDGFLVKPFALDAVLALAERYCRVKRD